MAALAALLRDDVTLELPPLATWFSGRETVLGYVASNLQPTAGRIRLVPAAANGQPAFAAYLRDAGGAYRAHAIIVLTLTGALITRIVIFLEPALFRLFGTRRRRARAGRARRLPRRGYAFGSGSDVQVTPSLTDLRITAPALVWPPAMQSLVVAAQESANSVWALATVVCAQCLPLVDVSSESPYRVSAPPARGV